MRFVGCLIQQVRLSGVLLRAGLRSKDFACPHTEVRHRIEQVAGLHQLVQQFFYRKRLIAIGIQLVYVTVS